VISLVMFVGLFGSVTWTQFFNAAELNADSRNTRSLYREYGTNRGPIVVDGKEIVASTPVNDAFKYQREYPYGALYAPVTGYYSIVYSPTGIERASNEYLNGTSDSLWLNRIEHLITGADPQGSAVELTIDEKAQRAAYDALGDQRGAAVAIEVKTGRILALVSKPSFDPSDLAGHSSKEVVEAYEKLLADPGKPLVNRALAGDTYPPGSVFKLVTTAAALENGMSAETEIDAPDTYRLPGTTTDLRNFGGSQCAASGHMSLANALRISCNTAFAALGNELGEEELAKQAQSFGFEQEIQVPMSAAISRYPTGQNDAQVAISAIGQQDVRVTPLQVAMMSAAIANDGVLMQPYLVDRVRTADLSVVSETKPQELGRAVSSSTARQLTEMMVGVVENGTGTSAQLSGIQVAGKTGTAETGGDAAPHAWFTAFAPADDPEIAVAVVVENGGTAGSEATGGRVAAPIARAVIKAVLDQ
jgi:peptidoglycan glycosyltransferase